MIEPGINRDKLFELIGYKPHAGQQLVHDSKYRFNIPCCGRRWGKTQCSARKITEGLFVPDSVWWIVGPQYTTGEKEFRVVFNDIMRTLNLGKYCKKSYNVEQGNMRIQMPWNAVVEVKSAEKQDSLVGEGLNGVIMSEAALHHRDTWDMYIEPTLVDKRGWALFPSTPRGFNWYEGLWQMGQSDDFVDFKSWRFPSWDNPIVFPGGKDDPEIVRIKNRVSQGHFAQEWAAEFTSFEGKIYEEFDPEVHITNIDYNPFWRNYWAFDFGFAVPFVCLDIMVDSSDRVYVWREYQVKHRTSYEHGLALKGRQNPEHFHVDGRFADPAGADAIATLTMLLGPVVARSVGVDVGLEAVKRAMKIRDDGKPGLYIDRSCKELIRQLQNLRTASVKGEKDPKEGQHKYDDHGPDALRYFFNELFVLNYGNSLSDVYGEARKRTEGETFFTYHENILMDSQRIPFS